MKNSNIKFSLILALCLSLNLYQANAANGFDVSYYQGAISQSQFSCFAGQGYTFAIIQAFIGGTGANPHFGGNFAAAQAAGFGSIDLYVFACNQCGYSPAGVVSAVQGALPSGFSGRFWLDVEPCNGCWGSPSDNLAFVQQVVSAAQSAGFNVGIYSSMGSWAAVCGSDSATTGNLAGLPLWYADWDGQANFNDGGYNFGGWSSPTMKQFNDGGNGCGTSFDYDWHP